MDLFGLLQSSLLSSTSFAPYYRSNKVSVISQREGFWCWCAWSPNSLILQILYVQLIIARAVVIIKCHNKVLPGGLQRGYEVNISDMNVSNFIKMELIESTSA